MARCPVCGLGLVALGLAAIPERAFGQEFLGPDVHHVTLVAALAILALLVVPLLYWVLIFLPVPGTARRRHRRDDDAGASESSQ